MTDLPDLVTWLRGQLDEDERVARNVDPQGWTEAIEAGHWNELDPTEYAHIARHDPARVLAEVAAKRAILDWCSERERIYVGTVATDVPRPEDFVDGQLKRPADAVVIRLLAQPYAGRPGWPGGVGDRRRRLGGWRRRATR